MKIRDGFVSNSSSSSFILKDDPALDGVSSSDLGEALRRLLGVPEEVKPCGSFCVFDMKAPAEAGKADECLGELLDEWICSQSMLGMDGSLLPAECRKWNDLSYEWDAFLEHLLPDELAKEGWWVDCEAVNPFRCEPKMYRYDRKGDSNEERPLPPECAERLFDEWRKRGLLTNRDAMLRPEARFAVHFDENDVWRLRGVDSESGFETEPYTYERICELVANGLKEAGRISPGLGWRFLRAITIAFNMHEG